MRLNDLSVFDKRWVEVSHAEVGIKLHGAGYGDLIIDVGSLGTGYDNTFRVTCTAAIGYMDKVALHDSVIYLNDLTCYGDLLATELSALGMDIGNAGSSLFLTAGTQ